MDYNSEKNLQIKKRFLEQEVVYQFTEQLNLLLSLGWVFNDAMFSGIPRPKDVKNPPKDATLRQIEWYIVSEYLHGELEAKGETVLQWGDCYFWGRVDNHVKMERDPVISETCEELQVLDGQEYEGAIKI